MTFAGRVLANGGGILLFLAVGWGVTQCLPALRNKSRLARLAYSYLIGVVFLCGGSWALSHFGGVPLRRTLFLWLAAVPVVAGVAVATVQRQKRDGPRDGDTWRRPVTVRLLGGFAFLVGLALTVGIFAQVLTEVTRDFDGQMTWTAAARYVRAAGTVDAPVLLQEKWFVTHPRYPLLMPLAQVTVQEVFGTAHDERAILGIYGFFFPVYLVVLWDGARQRSGSVAASLSVLAAALVPLFVFEESGGAAGTYGDFPLACFWGAAVLLLSECSLNWSRGVGAGLLLAASALTKNEGGPLALAALGAISVSILWRTFREAPGGKRSRLRRALPALAGACLVLGAALVLSFSWRSRIVNRLDEGYEDVRGAGHILSATFRRLPVLPGPMWHEMTDPKAWGLFWKLVPVGFLSGVCALKRRPALPLLLSITLGLTVFLVAYGITPWGGAELVHPTWSRFLLQLSLPGFVLLAMALARAVRTLRGLAAHIYNG